MLVEDLRAEPHRFGVEGWSRRPRRRGAQLFRLSYERALVGARIRDSSDEPRRSAQLQVARRNDPPIRLLRRAPSRTAASATAPLARPRASRLERRKPASRDDLLVGEVMNPSTEREADLPRSLPGEVVCSRRRSSVAPRCAPDPGRRTTAPSSYRPEAPRDDAPRRRGRVRSLR